MKKISIGLSVFLLLFLISLNPHLSSLFFTLQDFIKITDLFSQLLFGDFKLSL